MKIVNNRKLVLKNGKVFEGIGFGSKKEKIAEIVFNTSMVGYQEILSDSSYCDQFVCMTYPLIGNYGITDEDYESKTIKMSGFIVREYNDSNGYIFGNNVSRPANSNLYYLTLYVSNTPITSQNINFDNLTKINKINISDVRNGANNSQYFELSYKSVDESRFYAKNQNLVVVRENDSGTKELMFSINNYKKEFDYQEIYENDSEGNVIHTYQTYTWTIYLETYKI